MSTSDRALSQARSILGKLDRSIDQARERRLHGPGAVPPSPPAPLIPRPAIATLTPDRHVPQTPLAPSPSGNLRAQPLRLTPNPNL